MGTSQEPARADAGAPQGSIYDTESAAEMVRLLNKARLQQTNMGGLLPESPDPTRFSDVLDVACGPGAWCLDLAQSYPSMNVVGIDISETFITFARAAARELGLTNVTFKQMDALQPLDFLDASFDLINAKFLLEFMPKGGWLKLIQESYRLLRPSGRLRMTEYEIGDSNSPAHEHLCSLFIQAMYDLDRSISPGNRHLGILSMLSPTMRKAGFADIGRLSYTVDYSSGAPNHEEWCWDLMLKVKLTFPFLVAQGKHSAEDLEMMARRMEEQMGAPNFMALWHYMTVFGEKP
jgi:ubiquinone/menaquinone biosynthesis C-methylase UbiE